MELLFMAAVAMAAAAVGPMTGERAATRELWAMLCVGGREEEREGR